MRGYHVAELAEKVAALKTTNPAGYRSKSAIKRFAAINKLTFEEIPSDPADPKYRHGRRSAWPPSRKIGFR